jgi:diguanylate cyclase (GGDEF)-like protein/PAS domain S-box-containing protein
MNTSTLKTPEQRQPGSQRRSSNLYNHIVDKTSDGVMHLDPAGHVLAVNSAFEDLLGYERSEVNGRFFTKFLAPDHRDLFQEAIRQSKGGQAKQAGSPTKSITVTGHHRDGRALSLSLSLFEYQKEGKRRFVAIIKDISHLERLTQELAAAKDSYWALSETSTDAILQINEEFKIIYANAAAEPVFGYTSDEIIDKRFDLLFPPSVYERYDEQFRKYFIIDDRHRDVSKLSNTIEVLGKKKSNEIIPLEISFGNSRDIYGERLLTCIIRDITERKKIERKLRYLAYHDKLTDLGNRDLFYLTIGNFLAEVKRYKELKGALLFLDLDGFKKVNDTLGHDIGDEILCECARRLNGCLRESDHIYRISRELEPGRVTHEDLFRFGGDEFVILLTHLKRSTDAAIVAQKIIDAIKKPYRFSDVSDSSKIVMGVSIGIALIPENGLDAPNLIRSADVAMYKGKEVKNCYVYFSDEINDKANERLFLESGIRTALEKKLFQLHYQPLVDVEGNIKGVEALLRWEDAREGYIPPGRFIPIAEETGLIIPLGDWVLEKACTDLRYWNTHGRPDLYVSVNLSVKQFNQINIVDKLCKTIEKVGVDPKNLKIEITESSIVKNPSESREKIEEIKRRNKGMRIAIDDFGTGYSSLSYLSEFPVDTLKIDQTFVINLDKQKNTKIINTIIALAHSLNMEVIAEGVETKDQFSYLTSKNCQTFQGFYFGKAVPSDKITELLNKSPAS